MKKLVSLCALAFVLFGCQRTVKIEVEGAPSLSGTVRSSGPTQAEKDAAKKQAQEMIESLNRDNAAIENQMNENNRAASESMKSLKY